MDENTVQPVGRENGVFGAVARNVQHTEDPRFADFITAQ
jgi:hypothetical protein